MAGRSLCVAAVQLASQNGEREANLARAAAWVAQAAQHGAQLVLLPELFSGGYWLDERAWDMAEPQDGPTETWLRAMARAHRVHLGGSYLQARGEDFFNVFALATPAGDIAGRIPKQRPASVEAYLFRGQASSHIIATAIGRIGVGICYDNLFRFMPEALIAGDADLVLMPFSAPTPQQRWYYGRRQAQAFLASFRHAARTYARLLGRPAVQANKSGPWRSTLPAFFPAQDSRFDGQSQIADGDGSVVAQLGAEQTVIVGEVTLDPARKICSLGPRRRGHGSWITPVPAEFRLYWMIEAMGARAYRKSERRRARALARSAS